jgi:hypothetical protein
VPAIPETAMAASKAVNRDAPNALIAAHPPTKLTMLQYEHPYNSQIAPFSVLRLLDDHRKLLMPQQN